MIRDPVPACWHAPWSAWRRVLLSSAGCIGRMRTGKAASLQGAWTDRGRMADNYPYFHPLYAGQMLKPPHPVARAAYGWLWL